MRSKLLSVLLSLLLTSGYAEAHKMRSVLLTLTEQPSTANDSASRVVINLKSSLNKTVSRLPLPSVSPQNAHPKAHPLRNDSTMRCCVAIP
jgi:hypothetical protein